ncbi:hypothetical protein B6E66_33535 [Streptomyces maremycinicus]|nr:hypothetical protein B6E66_33535 [Streptomyces sp. B9173]
MAMGPARLAVGSGPDPTRRADRPAGRGRPGTRPTGGASPAGSTPGDLPGLAEHCCCPEDASEETEERRPWLRFRARAAPHES